MNLVRSGLTLYSFHVFSVLFVWVWYFKSLAQFCRDTITHVTLDLLIPAILGPTPIFMTASWLKKAGESRLQKASDFGSFSKFRLCLYESYAFLHSKFLNREFELTNFNVIPLETLLLLSVNYYRDYANTPLVALFTMVLRGIARRD